MSIFMRNIPVCGQCRLAILRLIFRQDDDGEVRCDLCAGCTSSLAQQYLTDLDEEKNELAAIADEIH